MPTTLNISLTAYEREAVERIANDLAGFSNIRGGDSMQPLAVAAARGAIKAIAQEAK